jgi:hypothetical protein
MPELGGEAITLEPSTMADGIEIYEGVYSLAGDHVGTPVMRTKVGRGWDNSLTTTVTDVLIANYWESLRQFGSHSMSGTSTSFVEWMGYDNGGRRLYRAKQETIDEKDHTFRDQGNYRIAVTRTEVNGQEVAVARTVTGSGWRKMDVRERSEDHRLGTQTATTLRESDNPLTCRR